MKSGATGGRYEPIADYAVIGDCHTVALVCRGGSIDWYCPDRFDAPAVFCRLLDADKGGFFRVAPREGIASERRYAGPTNVLETVHRTPTGRVRVTDFMPIYQRQEGREGYDVGAYGQILRLVEALDGEAEVEVVFKPTFDYARAPAQIEVVEGGAVARSGSQYLTLAFRGEGVAIADGTLRAVLRLWPGQRTWLQLTHGETPATMGPSDCDARLESTVRYWRQWSSEYLYRGEYRAEVQRSALALKLLMYEPTGAFVAAPTTSLPEEVGGVRNWDYRYSWLRDASLILHALTGLGYRGEATDFFGWLRQCCHRGRPQIMYGIDCRHDLTEVQLDHLEGYRGSRPVRVGNGAFGQQQVDIYGEVMNAAYARYVPDGISRPDEEGLLPETWTVLRRFADAAARQWREPDSGIWEVRGNPQEFLYSRLMCWVALDRAIKLAEERHLAGNLDHWRRERETIRDAILMRGFDQKQRAFTQALGSPIIDASALAIPRMGFLPATDPRVQSTIDRVRDVLGHGGLICRYRTRETKDGVPGGEGAFVLCTFWMVEALALAGRLDEAYDLFEHTVGFANDVGLLSEEVDPVKRELLGNFPQGFSHLALVQAAVALARAEQRGVAAAQEAAGGAG